MRKLTIKRKKSFVGCLAKIKVYIEDQMSSELTINGVPCRKLGVIKNGKEKTFEIEDEAAKVYVIADKMSKDYCNEFYQLEDGEEDIRLTGKNHFSPSKGNPFYFDGNNDPEALENRKKNKKKSKKLILTCFIVGFIIGLLIAFL